MRKIFLLGVPIDACTQVEAVAAMQEMLKEEKQCHVMTPNSEMLVEATRNPKLFSLLQRTALNLPDSIGVVLMAKFVGQDRLQRVTGVDTVEGLCRSLTEEIPVFFLGASPGIAEQAAAALQGENPHLKITGTYAGTPKPEDAAAICAAIQNAKPLLLLVAYGAPQQDLWIDQHLAQLPSVRVAIGVGGTLDFLAGKVRRAPNMLQNLGLEWLWRLCLEPWRFMRIIRATLVFPFLVLRSRFGGAAPRAQRTTPARLS